MIILSGVLVVVAIVLLIVGIVAGNSGTEVVGLDGLNLIYISIGVSIVSALFLAIGVFLRRKDLFGPPAASSTGSAARTSKRGKRAKDGKDKDKAAQTEPVSGPPAAAGATPGPPIAGRSTDADTAELAATLPSPVDVPADAVVYVVPGRRRYHIDSCRHLAGRDKEELTFEEARDEGFSPCTACMPDTALAARAVAAEPATDKPPAEEGTAATASEGRETGLGEESAPAADRMRASGGDEREGAFDAPGTNGSAASAAPAHRHPIDDLAEDGPAADPIDAGDEPAEDTDASADRPTTVDDETANPVGGVGETPAEETASDKAVTVTDVPRHAAAEDKGRDDTSAAGAPQVRILSGTKRYHRPDCALIEDIGDEADDLESLTRDEAKARGCTPCLVCQPDKEPATRD